MKYMHQFFGIFGLYFYIAVHEICGAHSYLMCIAEIMQIMNSYDIQSTLMLEYFTFSTFRVLDETHFYRLKKLSF